MDTDFVLAVIHSFPLKASTQRSLRMSTYLGEALMLGPLDITKVVFVLGPMVILLLLSLSILIIKSVEVLKRNISGRKDQ